MKRKKVTFLLLLLLLLLSLLDAARPFLLQSLLPIQICNVFISSPLMEGLIKPGSTGREQKHQDPYKYKSKSSMTTKTICQKQNQALNRGTPQFSFVEPSHV
jgi:hypothetical protein